MTNIFSRLQRTIDARFWSLVLLNLAASAFVLSSYYDAHLIAAWVVCSPAMAYFENALLRCLPRKASNVCYYAILGLYALLMAVDTFCTILFGTCINEITLQIICNTNLRESAEFANEYFSFTTILTVVAIPAIIIAATVWIDRKLKCNARWAKASALAAVLAGLIFWCVMCISFVTTHQGLNIPQMNVLTRTAQACATTSKSMAAYRQLAMNAADFEAQKAERTPDIVVVIGESFSRYHSSLYGYDKATNPALEEIEQKGNLVVFTDVTGDKGDTHSAMPDIFSLGNTGDNISSYPMFPMLFKRAGYGSVLMSNQFVAGNDISFLSDADLSALMFDSRNDRLYDYDGDMVDLLEPRDAPTLYVIHLLGQHYTYENRYPAAFARFSSSDYPGIPANRAQTIAAYDNATLYNDYVVSQLIDKFKDRDCCLIYFSDHGEYVCESSDFYGHGYRTDDETGKYLYNLPFIVWMSDAFMRNYPELCAVIRNSATQPIRQSDIAQMVIDIAGLNTPWFDGSRSPLAPR